MSAQPQGPGHCFKPQFEGQGYSPGPQQSHRLRTKRRSCHLPRASSLPSSLEQSNSQPTKSNDFMNLLGCWLNKEGIKKSIWRNGDPSFSVHKTFIFSSALPGEISIKLAEVIAKELIDKIFVKLTHTYSHSLFKTPWQLCIMFTYMPPPPSLFKSFSGIRTSGVMLLASWKV